MGDGVDVRGHRAQIGIVELSTAHRDHRHRVLGRLRNPAADELLDGRQGAVDMGPDGVAQGRSELIAPAIEAVADRAGQEELSTALDLVLGQPGWYRAGRVYGSRRLQV